MAHDVDSPDDDQAVRRDLEVELDPDEVWKLLTDDDERAGWFGGPTTLEPVPGGHGDFTDPDGTRRHATVEEAEPGRHLRWTWWPADDEDPGGLRTSRVDVEIAPVPGGSRIAVTETPLTPVARAAAAPLAGRLLDLELAGLVRSLHVRA